MILLVLLKKVYGLLKLKNMDFIKNIVLNNLIILYMQKCIVKKFNGITKKMA